MKVEQLKDLNLPDAPGVYFFHQGDNLSYIGRATSLKDRVRSYFSNDLIKTRGPLIVDMVTSSDRLSWQETDSLLEAIILEAELIRKHQPPANTKEKDDRSFNYVVITDEDFPRVLIERGRNLEVGNHTVVRGKETLKLKRIFGPYTNPTLLREALKIVRKIFPFRDSCNPESGRPCFNYQIGLCPGVCVGKVSKAEYSKSIRLISLFFEGRKLDVVKELEQEMKSFAQNMEFEKANSIKRTLLALSHIQDIALVKDDRLGSGSLSRAGIVFDEKTGVSFDPERIEAYDVAHISGKHIVGVMVVMRDGEFDKRAYRKFKVSSTESADEVKSLSEILSRRLRHLEWPLPKYIVVDGNAIQLNAANKVLADYPSLSAIGIKVVSVVKDDKHKAREVLGLQQSQTEGLKTLENAQLEKDIIKINSEAHRFAVTYHRLLRSKENFKKIGLGK